MSAQFLCTRVQAHASFAIHPDGKGQSACVVMLGNTLVHEVCRKQKIVTKNSTEAEFVALADLLIKGELVEDFVLELGHMMGMDFVTDVHLIYQDNKSTLAMVSMGGGKPRTKYMKVREEFVKERLKTWEVELEYISTKQMLADLMTKPLGGELYHTLTHRLLRGHRYACLNNRGAKGKQASCVNELASVGSVVPILVLQYLACSNHAPAWLLKKHSTKYVPNGNTRIKQRKG